MHDAEYSTTCLLDIILGICKISYMEHVPVWNNNLPKKKAVESYRRNVQGLKCWLSWHEIL